jgi:hypothetical protein
MMHYRLEFSLQESNGSDEFKTTKLPNGQQRVIIRNWQLLLIENNISSEKELIA